ncbi:MAG: haloalkane dehalogenase [Pseudomonadota bacterium]|nr:haloalkane dehalogenase [Pseudomonadota bacterium]
MKVLRTAEKHFSGLPDYDFKPNYLSVPDKHYGDLRMHYLDEGEPSAPVVLLTPTQGSWVYMYRHMIPLLVNAGLRVVVPDYIGFGRSDKLPRESDYSFQNHIDWLKSFFNQLEIQNATGFLYDWGGFLGLRIAAEEPHYFAGLVALNTQLPTGGPSEGHTWFRSWRKEMLAKTSFPQGEMVASGVHTKLSAEVIAAYDAPYPEESYKSGPRRFPMILPIELDDPARPANLRAWEKLAQWKKPLLTLYSADFIGTSMGPEQLMAQVPGSIGQDHAGIKNAGFYIVEDAGPELAWRVIDFVAMLTK